MATIDVKCRFCNETDDVKKHGTCCGHHQRYRCQSYRKTFQIDYTYRACKPGIKEQIVDLAMNNAGIRDTARALHISINGVVRALKKLSPRCVTILPLSKYQHIEYMTLAMIRFRRGSHVYHNQRCSFLSMTNDHISSISHKSTIRGESFFKARTTALRMVWSSNIMGV